MFKLLSLACLVFGFIVLCWHQLSRLMSTVIQSVCLMKLASGNRVGGMAVNAFLPSKIVTVLGKGPIKTKLPRWTPWGDQLSTLLGGNALICAVGATMSAECLM